MSREVALPFPIRGHDAGRAYSAQPALTTPDCLNVRGYSCDEERARGGSRPGVRPAYEQELAEGAGVQWLGWLDWGYGDRVQYADAFDYPEGPLCAQAAWSEADPGLAVSAGHVHPAGGSLPYEDLASGEYQSFGGDTWEDFALDASLRWTWGARGSITLWVSSAAGGAAGGARVTVAYESAWVAWPGLGFTSVLTITLESGAHKAVHSRPMGVLFTQLGGALRVEADAQTVRALWDGAVVAAVPRDAGTCSKAGFSMSLSKPEGSPMPDALVDFRLLDWRLSAGTRAVAISRKLVAVAGGEVWAESAEGELASQAEGTRTLADVPLCSAAHHGGRLFLVDGLSPSYYDPMATGERVFAWTARRGGLDPTCRLIVNWRNRLALAGAASDPRELVLSRQDDPWDFDFGASDPKAAVSSGQCESGRVSDPITALCPLSDDVLVIGCTRSLWALHGDPMSGGRLVRKSDQTGILCQNAWATDPQGNLYFLGEEGLFVCTPLGAPKNLSAARVPGLLAGAGESARRGCRAVQPGRAGAAGETFVSLVYDADREGLLILLTPLGGGPARHWFYDLRHDAFWPESYPEAVGPSCAAYYSAERPEHRKLLLGGAGRLYQFDEEAGGDLAGGEETPIDSHVWIGPVRLAPSPSTAGGAASDAVVTGLSAVLSRGSDGASFAIHAADTAEGALSAPAAASGVWSAGRNAARCRVRGGAHAVRVGRRGEAGRWAMESLTMEVAPGGRMR